MPTLDTISTWLIRAGLTFIFLMMAAYIGWDLYVDYMNEHYIVIPLAPLA